MDQVKVVLAVVKKHHFWVLSGVVVVVGVVIWWSATAGLADRIDDRKGALENQHGQVAKISQEPMHPNQEVVDAILAERQKVEDKVLLAWKELHRIQKKDNPWPEQELGPEFVRWITALGPDEEIPERQRATYQTFIQDHFKPLCEIVDIRLPKLLDEFGLPIKDEQTGAYIKAYPFEKPASGRGPSSSGRYDPEEGRDYMGSSGTRNTELVGKVFWDPQDLDRLHKAFNWPTIPTTAQVRLAQEDLWVYEALLRIIKNTNEGATSHHNAAVKRIMALEIGQRASPTLARALGRTPGAGASMAGYPGRSPGYGESDYYDYEEDYRDSEEGYERREYSSPSALDTTGTSTEQPKPEERLRRLLIQGRYVDERGTPLSADQADKQPGFKLMPVRMLLVIDQRRMLRLLVNCANESMPVVPRRWAVNPGKGMDWRRIVQAASPRRYSGYGGRYEEDEDADYGGGYSGGGYGGGAYSGSGYPGRGYEGESDSSYGGSTLRRDQAAQESYDVVFEILGVIQIYNPADEDKLRTWAAGEVSATPSSEEPAAAAAATSPTAPGA